MKLKGGFVRLVAAALLCIPLPAALAEPATECRQVWDIITAVVRHHIRPIGSLEELAARAERAYWRELQYFSGLPLAQVKEEFEAFEPLTFEGEQVSLHCGFATEVSEELSQRGISDVTPQLVLDAFVNAFLSEMDPDFSHKFRRIIKPSSTTFRCHWR